MSKLLHFGVAADVARRGLIDTLNRRPLGSFGCLSGEAKERNSGVSLGKIRD
jgi:hypothetical protein